MGSGGGIFDAVALFENVAALAEADLDNATRHDQHLVGIAMRVEVGAGRTADFEFTDIDFHLGGGATRQKGLATAMAGRNGGALAAPQHTLGRRRRRLLEKRGDCNAKRCRHLVERGRAGACQAPFELADEAGAGAGPVRELTERKPAPLPQILEALAEFCRLGSGSFRRVLHGVLLQGRCDNRHAINSTEQTVQ